MGEGLCSREIKFLKDPSEIRKEKRPTLTGGVQMVALERTEVKEEEGDLGVGNSYERKKPEPISKA